MKKLVYLLSFIFLPLFLLFVVPSTHAQDATTQVGTGIASEGAWIIDPEVTRIGKNASRSGQLLDWTLQDYQWASSAAQQTSNSPLSAFWVIIQRIVYALFLVVIMITAFVLIVTRGKSLSAKRFLPRFFLAILLVTFSFSLIQFIYQITDILQGFFLKNPQGQIISSKDLLYIGFNYTDFQGLRRFGLPYEESAFISLILVKFTAFTYYVMALLLIFRKILLWFFIILSPLFPILLLFYPVRNTGKIWIGEFFRWVMYAPLFAIFLSGLVKLWNAGLPLIFNFSGVAKGQEVYPTAINILLGGPGQQIGLKNSVNLPDTFALYVVALIMLWAVIILPFILLQIFLDHMMAFNYQDSPLGKQMMGLINTRFTPPPKPLGPTPPPAGAGLARSMPFGRRFEIPNVVNRGTGLARQLPRLESNQENVQRPTTVKMTHKVVVSNLTNLAIPTMRDIARFETTRLARDTKSLQEVSKVKETLRQIANPTSSVREHDRFQMIRERLQTEGQKGNQYASTILNAANIYNYYSSQTDESSVVSNTQQLINNLSQPEKIESRVEKESIVKIKEQLVQAASAGNVLAQTILNSVTSSTTNQLSHLKQSLQDIAHPEKVVSTNDRQVFTSLREKIVTASKSGNQLANLLMTSLEKTTSTEEVKTIQEKLLEAQAQGSPLATEILKTVDTKSQVTEADAQKIEAQLQEASKKGDPLAITLLKTLQKQKTKQGSAPVAATTKLKASSFPVVNRVQEVSLDDYEAVKKMWKENYQNLEVPQTTTGQVSRKNWITQDIADIEQTITLLTSTNPDDVQKGMQQVSDILPFLLIGGFSQTEIIAYLKAKMEAGKTVLEDVSKAEDEEDTLLAAKRTTKTAENHLSATTEIAEPGSHDQPLHTTNAPTINNTSVSNTYVTHNESTSQITQQTTQPVTTSSSQDITTTQSSLFNLIQLPILTLRDIVRFETADHTSAPKERLESERIKNILVSLANPTAVTSVKEREQVATLRAQLEKEEKAGNPLATIILNAITQVSSESTQLTSDQTLPFVEVLQTVANMSQQSLVTDSALQEIRELIKRGEEQRDPLVLALVQTANDVQKVYEEKTKTFLEKLSNPSSMVTASEQMHYNKLVERIAQASESGNQIASTIVQAISHPVTPEVVYNLFTTITNASAQGDTLSTYITENLYTLPQEKQQTLSLLYQKVAEKGKQGDKLSQTLLSFLKKNAKAKDSQETKVGATPLLPAKNRLKPVSLDDYEAVKKMWKENYQNIDLSQTGESTTQQARREWISNDVATIEQTISLLSSSNVEDVQKGMQQVSDILPFLLLGGFSQSEVVGYLKAKLEAGKAVLEETKKEEEKDNTLISTHRTVPSSQHEQHAAMTASPSITNNTSLPSPGGNTSTNPSLLDLIKLPELSLRDLVTFESAQQASSSPEKREVERIKNILVSLANPSAVSSLPEREKMVSLRSQLEKEDKAGSPLASMILQAIDHVSSTDSSTQELNETDEFAQLLQSLSQLQSSSPSDQELREMQTLLRQGVEEKDPFVMSLVETASEIEKTQIERTQSFLEKLSNPTTIPSEPERAYYSRLSTEIANQNKEGNKTAAALTHAVSQPITPEAVKTLYQTIMQAVSSNDSLATTIAQTIFAHSDSQQKNLMTLIQTMKEREKAGHKLAVALVILLKKQPRARSHKEKQVTGKILPLKNRIKPVTLDDYEAVKKMWIENYQKSQPPQNENQEVMTREEWLKQEKEHISSVLNLLASDDQEQVRQGTEAVGDILPFILLGGFSQTEVVGYLKAKLEAANFVLAMINQETEEVTVDINPSQTRDKAETMEQKPDHNE